ncbi:MAG TPA: carbohydrate ABC transporter permease [Lachnospiraceae bacterium]
MISSNKPFKIITTAIMLFLVLACIAPFVLLIASSFTSEEALVQNGYKFFPTVFSTEAYKYLWSVRDAIFQSYIMSFIITGLGTILSLTMTVLFAYPLSRKDLPGRNAISFFLFFTMLFNGGFVPTYIIYSKYIHITDSLAGLIVPYLLMNAFYVIMVRTYFTSNIPNEVIEAAHMDGAGEMTTLLRIVLPMSRPILGTIGLMSAIAYWNNWTNGVYFITTRRDLYGIQNYLNTVISNIQFLQSHSDPSISIKSLPSVSIRMAIAVIAIVPILAVYPYFQKSFAKGITVGAVKG